MNEDVLITTKVVKQAIAFLEQCESLSLYDKLEVAAIFSALVQLEHNRTQRKAASSKK